MTRDKRARASTKCWELINDLLYYGLEAREKFLKENEHHPPGCDGGWEYCGKCSYKHVFNQECGDQGSAWIRFVQAKDVDEAIDTMQEIATELSPVTLR